jgi:hypothetical protein
MSGIAAVDQARVMLLAELTLDFCREHLKPGGALLVKVFQGEGFMELRKAMQEMFETLHLRKPAASRDRSAEIYLLARGKRAPEGRKQWFAGCSERHYNVLMFTPDRGKERLRFEQHVQKPSDMARDRHRADDGVQPVQSAPDGSGYDRVFRIPRRSQGGADCQG